MSAEFHAGNLIRSGALAVCLRAYHEHGANAHAWSRVRAILRELYPDAHVNSIEAVVAIAIKGRKAGNRLLTGDPKATCPPRQIPDARRLIRDAKRALRKQAGNG